MKINKLVKFEQILKFYLLLQISKYSKKKINLTQSIKNLKNILNTIFKFHKASKNILFVGLSNNTLNLKINKLTNHLSINSKCNFDLLLPKLTKKPDIILIVSKNKQKNFLNSNLNAIPLIYLDYSNYQKMSLINYLFNTKNTNKNLQILHETKLFFFGLNFFFKRF